MQTRSVACAFLGLIAVAGCYESPVPLAPASKAVMDERLVGRWELVRGDGEETSDLLVLRFNERELYARSREGQKDAHFRAYVVVVDGARFVNAQSLEERDRSFYFFRYDIGPDSVLTLRMVSGRSIPKPIESSEKLRTFIREHLGNEELYEDPDRFRRAHGS